MTAPSGLSCCKSCLENTVIQVRLLRTYRVGNAVSANLTDTNKLPVEAELVEVVKKQGWISDEYLHLWRRDEGGSAALTSHGILSLSVQSQFMHGKLTFRQHSYSRPRETVDPSALFH